jgi:anti-sigma factor ChrR (cupin superfamily)
MKQNHIIELLERGPLSSLSENELRAISTHTEICPACHQAYEAARIATLLVKERAAETMEPSPFFQTRVLAALREQQADNKVPAFWRLWKTAGALVSTMALTTAALAALSFIAPGTATVTTQNTMAESSPYSAEAIVFNQDQNEEQITDEQVLSVIYADEGEAK